MACRCFIACAVLGVLGVLASACLPSSPPMPDETEVLLSDPAGKISITFVDGAAGFPDRIVGWRIDFRARDGRVSTLLEGTNELVDVRDRAVATRLDDFFAVALGDDLCVVSVADSAASGSGASRSHACIALDELGSHADVSGVIADAVAWRETHAQRGDPATHRTNQGRMERETKVRWSGLASSPRSLLHVGEQAAQRSRPDRALDRASGDPATHRTRANAGGSW